MGKKFLTYPQPGDSRPHQTTKSTPATDGNTNPNAVGATSKIGHLSKSYSITKLPSILSEDLHHRCFQHPACGLHFIGVFFTLLE
jgi:hypothetical protein